MFNPGTRFLVRRGLAPACYVLLETTGRRTGTPRQTPVVGSLDGDTYWLVSEHGAANAYVKNLTAHPAVRVFLRGKWQAGTATCLPEDDPVARRAWINKRNGLVGRFDGVFHDAFSTTPMTVRIDLDS